MRHLDAGVDADAVAIALLGNAVRGLMERYGIAEARKYAEGFLHGYLDRAACDPGYEHLLGVPQHGRTARGAAGLVARSPDGRSALFEPAEEQPF